MELTEWRIDMVDGSDDVYVCRLCEQTEHILRLLCSQHGSVNVVNHQIQVTAI